MFKNDLVRERKICKMIFCDEVSASIKEIYCKDRYSFHAAINSIEESVKPDKRVLTDFKKRKIAVLKAGAKARIHIGTSINSLIAICAGGFAVLTSFYSLFSCGRIPTLVAVTMFLVIVIYFIFALFLMFRVDKHQKKVVIYEQIIAICENMEKEDVL